MEVKTITVYDEFKRPMNMPSIIFPESGLAIHRTLNIPYGSIFWSVTHLLSGYCVCSGLHSYQHARRFIDRFPLASGIDFTLDLETIKQSHYRTQRQQVAVHAITEETFKFTEEVKDEHMPRTPQPRLIIEHC